MLSLVPHCIVGLFHCTPGSPHITHRQLLKRLIAPSRHAFLHCAQLYRVTFHSHSRFKPWSIWHQRMLWEVRQSTAWTKEHSDIDLRGVLTRSSLWYFKRTNIPLSQGQNLRTAAPWYTRAVLCLKGAFRGWCMGVPIVMTQTLCTK